ncbi:phosphoglycerate mutase-like protein [Peniophora sp. CONT]|nr:phosphoglycerate mutase-like protein [Peniophora sp. CONT]
MSTPTLYVTFIRHGESTDNVRSVWAGWKDAPLTNHGMNQALACGKSLATTHFSAIYASPLKRAYSTSRAVYDAQLEPKPAFTVSPLIREQYFGVAEGHSWQMHQEKGLTLEEQFAKGIYPVLFGDDEKFPEGESSNDLADRAKQAIDELVMPQVLEAARAGKKGVHIALVSHGLCISHLISQLLQKNDGGAPKGDYRGLMNTAWSRVTVDVPVSKEGTPLEIADNDLPPLTVKVTHVNEHKHIDGIKRQKGGIGSAAFDPKQGDIRAFFGGKTDALEHAESNAHDEVDTEDPTSSA